MPRDITSNLDSDDISTNGLVGRLGAMTNALTSLNERLSSMNGAITAPPPDPDRTTILSALSSVQQQVSAAQATINSINSKLGTPR